MKLLKYIIIFHSLNVSMTFSNVVFNLTHSITITQINYGTCLVDARKESILSTHMAQIFLMFQPYLYLIAKLSLFCKNNNNQKYLIFFINIINRKVKLH